MYRTKLYWPGVFESKTTLKIPFNSEISYASKAFTYGGTTKLIEPTTGTFATFGAAQKVVGKYVEQDGNVYLIPSGSTLVSGGSSFSAPAQKVTYAPWTLFSGADQKDAIKSNSIFWTSNSGDDLTMGSVCAANLECKIITSEMGFGIDAGSQFQAFKVAEDGTETQIGVFNVETPTRTTAHSYKITAYDNVRKLDKDLSEWFNALDGWPYQTKALAEMIAEQCGLTISVFEAPSYDDLGADDYYVYRFTVSSGTTGRQLMSWICEALCDFCVADTDGSLKCVWYGGNKVKIGPNSDYDHSYLQGSLTNEDYNAAEISGIEILEETSASGQVVEEDTEKNPYQIIGNPVILSHPYNNGVSMVEDTSTGELVMTPYGKWRMGLLFRFNLLKTYTPFRVEIPESLNVAIGSTVEITDSKGNTFESHLMNLTWKGHRMTLECTGNRTRANANAPSTLTNKQLMEYSDQTAKKAVSSISAESADYPGCYCRTVDGETEWINPPMIAGEEYRTTKRYNSKPVYIKLVDFGALPNAATKTVSCGAVGPTVISWRAVILSSTDNAGIFPWYDSSGNLLAMAYINSSGSIYVKTFSDQSAATAKFIIEYVKE